MKTLLLHPYTLNVCNIFPLGVLSIHHCPFIVFKFLGSDASCMPAHSSVVYKRRTDTEHTCGCSSLSFYSCPCLPPSFSTPNQLLRCHLHLPALSMERRVHVWEKSVCMQWLERGRGRSCVLYLWVVEKPACPLGAERGGACGVWDNRQRRHIHSDTGSLEEKERQTAGDPHFPLRRQSSNSWGYFLFLLLCVLENFVRKLPYVFFSCVDSLVS